MEKKFKPVFSVIMPVYNREKSVLTAVHSVLAQTFSDFELVIIDDASTDSTVSVLHTLNDSRIIVLEQAVNYGPAAARNKGIIASRGRFISFLDSDDTYEPDFLAETFKLLESSNSNIGFMWTGMHWIEDGVSRIQSWTPVFHENSYITFLHSLHIGTNSGLTIKRDVFNHCGLFDEQLKAAEDTDLFLRITQKYDYVFTTKPLIKIHRDNKDRLSKNLHKNAMAYTFIYPKHQKVIERYSTLQLKFYYKMMWLSYYLPDRKKAFQFFKLLLKNRLLKPKMLIVFLLYQCLPFSFASRLHQR
jgi:glycosyltransferase involved in cell wall biosynthesis